MTINAAGLALIKKFERCVLTAYDDGTGVWTVGYGHTHNVTPNMVITQAQADAFLAQDIAIAESVVNGAAEVDLTPNQFSALVSFEFNTGALEGSTLLKLVNSEDFRGAADQFLKWVWAGGEILAGLEARRAAERALFLNPVE
jgi:lysozyme